jgi:hypothetical protein
MNTARNIPAVIAVTISGAVTRIRSRLEAGRDRHGIGGCDAIEGELDLILAAVAELSNPQYITSTGGERAYESQSDDRRG